MSRREIFKLEEVKRQLLYILGRSPDEFGLLPDTEGFVKIKELIQVLHEEGLSYVRKSHIDELIMWEGKELFETDEEGKRIKAKHQDWESDFITPPHIKEVPKILYTCVRKRAYPVVLEKGLFSNDNSYIILSDSEEMALRIGRRKSSELVLLEVRTHDAMNQGSSFFSFGRLYLSHWIPAQCIFGPPLESKKEKPIDKKKKKKKEEKEKIKEAFSAGTFFMTEKKKGGKEKKGKGKKKKSWKEEVRKLRKRKDPDFF